MQYHKPIIDNFSILGGEPISFGTFEIYQPTLDTIRKIGYQRYSQITNLLTISESDLLVFFDKEKITNFSSNPLEYLYEKSLQEPQFFFSLREGFLLYLKKDLFLDKNKKVFKIIVKQEVNGELFDSALIIDKELFYQIQEIIRKINFIESEQEDEIISDNEEMKKKFEASRKKLKLAKAKAKRKDRDDSKKIDFYLFVSALCVFSPSYNLFNVWDLTIYQFYIQFKMNQFKEDYESNVKIALSGMSKKKIDLQYWIKQI